MSLINVTKTYKLNLQVGVLPVVLKSTPLNKTNQTSNQLKKSISWQEARYKIVKRVWCHRADQAN